MINNYFVASVGVAPTLIVISLALWEADLFLIFRLYWHCVGARTPPLKFCTICLCYQHMLPLTSGGVLMRLCAPLGDF